MDNIERVVAFVLHPNGEVAGDYASMEFYAFSPRFGSPTFKLDWFPASEQDQGSKIQDSLRALKLDWFPAGVQDQGSKIEDSHRARPFTGLNSSPLACSFASFGSDIYVTGGTMCTAAVIHGLDAADNGIQVLQIANQDPYLSKNHSKFRSDIIPRLYDDWILDNLVNLNYMIDLAYMNSNRVKCFQLPKFINSLFENNKHGELKFGNLDDASNDSSTYWKACPSLLEGRSKAHLLSLGGKLYAIGGNEDSSLIEVFDHHGWTPLLIEPPPDVDPYFLVSAAIKESNKILVGSNGTFYVIDVSNGKGVAKCEERAECPIELLDGSSEQPGVVDKHCILWYDGGVSCIRGFHLSTNRFFIVDSLCDILFPTDEYNVGSTKLADLGDGILCLIYTGLERYTSIDDRGVEYALCDYRCVTFKIDYGDFLDNGLDIPFPGPELKPVSLSGHKCYAPFNAQFGAAFAMDVNFPPQEYPAPACDVAVGSQVSDTNLDVAPTQVAITPTQAAQPQKTAIASTKPPPPSKNKKRKSKT